MSSRLRKVHFISGFITVIVFLFTGFYMQRQFPDIYLPNEIIRMQFRANHVYILLAGLHNIGLGSYLAASRKKRGPKLQAIGSISIFVATTLLIIAFFKEPIQASPDKPITTIAMLSLLLGTILHAVGSSREQA
ncbi:MAG: hypothetical protein AB1489_18010 [Acidobacteriota bacterium]